MALAQRMHSERRIREHDSDHAWCEPCDLVSRPRRSGRLESRRTLRSRDPQPTNDVATRRSSIAAEAVRRYTNANSTTDYVASDYVGQGTRRCVLAGDGGWRSFSMRILDDGSSAGPADRSSSPSHVITAVLRRS